MTQINETATTDATQNYHLTQIDGGRVESSGITSIMTTTTQTQTAVTAACAAARLALPACDGYDAAPNARAVALAAIETAERWLRGEATIEQLHAAERAAWSLAFRGDDASGAALFAAGYAAHAARAKDPAKAFSEARAWAALAVGYRASGALIACQAGAAAFKAARQAALDATAALADRPRGG